jgi:hypothetical protein
MSEEERLDIVAAILASGIDNTRRSLQEDAAIRVMTYRRIKAMLRDHGTEPLAGFPPDQGPTMLRRLADEGKPENLEA